MSVLHADYMVRSFVITKKEKTLRDETSDTTNPNML